MNILKKCVFLFSFLVSSLVFGMQDYASETVALAVAQQAIAAQAASAEVEQPGTLRKKQARMQFSEVIAGLARALKATDEPSAMANQVERFSQLIETYQQDEELIKSFLEDIFDWIEIEVFGRAPRPDESKNESCADDLPDFEEGEKKLFSTFTAYDAFAQLAPLDAVERRDWNSFTQRLTSYGKEKLLSLLPLIEVYDRYHHLLNPSLPKMLRFQFSYLPCIREEQFLSNREIVTRILEELLEQEKRLVNSFVKKPRVWSGGQSSPEEFVALELSSRDCHRLAILAGDNEMLYPEAQKRVRTIIRIILHLADDEPLVDLDWNQHEALEGQLEEACQRRKSIYFTGANPRNNQYITALRSSVKAKKYFREQLLLEEEAIRIPFWYHATNPRAFDKICESGEIRPSILVLRGDDIRYGAANLPGAWVSAQYEHMYGRKCFAFTSEIQTQDIVCRRNFSHAIRHRGTTLSIPLDKGLAFVGVARHGRKSVRRSRKMKARRILQENGLGHVRAFSMGSLNAIRSSVFLAVGTPNLRPEWW